MWLASMLLVKTVLAQDPPFAWRPGPTKLEERRTFHEPAVRGADMRIRLDAYNQRLKMIESSPWKNIPWRNIGPEFQGGRVIDIESPAGRPEQLFVAFATGGLWLTTSEGNTWTPLFDNQSAFGIGDTAVSADGQTIWVGTGESNSQRTSYSGTGIFKSTDGGKTWANMGLPESHHIGRVVVDPKNPDVVWVAALGHLYSHNRERGVYKTTDGGKTWQLVKAIDEKTGAVDIAIDPRNPNVVYASFWERDRRAWNFLESGPGSGIWKTTDGGKTWSQLTGLPKGVDMGRTAISIAPSRPDTLYAFMDNQGPDEMADAQDEFTRSGQLTLLRFRQVPFETFRALEKPMIVAFLRRYLPRDTKFDDYAQEIKDGKVTANQLEAKMLEFNPNVFDRPQTLAQVWRSDDAGKTWRKTGERMGDHGGYYWNKQTVHPLNHEELYTLGLLILRSRDGGKTWDEIGTRNHVDHHAYYIDPRQPNRHWNGNDGGIYQSLDAGETWRHVNNLPVGQPTTLALDNKVPYNVYIGLQDNGTIKGPSTYRPGFSNPRSWTSIGGGDGSWIAVDPRGDGDIVFIASQFGAHSGIDQVKNTRWSARAPGKPGQPPLRYNWISPLIISQHHPDIVYLGSQKLHRSFNHGRNWEDLSDDLTKNLPNGDVPFSTLTALAESPFKFGRIYIGADDGTVKTTPDGGVTWVDIATPAPDRWVTRIVASKWDEATVYVTQNGYRQNEWTSYVWKSTNYGKSWTSLSAGLPAEAVNSIREDPVRKGLLYVATDMGVYASLDGGGKWFPYGAGMPHLPVHDIAIHPRDKELVAATHARSVFVVSVKLLQEITDEIMGQDLHLYKVENLTGRERWGYERYQPYENVPPAEPSFEMTLWSKPSGDGVVKLVDKDGKTVIERKVGIDAGINFLRLSMLLKAGDRFAPPAKPTDPKSVEQALADPYLARRAQYPPAGEYKLVIEVGGKSVSQEVRIAN